MSRTPAGLNVVIPPDASDRSGALLGNLESYSLLLQAKVVTSRGFSLDNKGMTIR
jgi:hypothetical protein